jgi:F-type H+-transporting ATPase subunit b
MSFEAEFWVAVAFVIFLAVLAKFNVHRKMLGSLDERRDRIKTDLDEAQRLREEAKAMLADADAKRRAAEQEAAGIIDGARAEAERLAGEAKQKVEEFLGRRTKMAEAKIAQAEAQALADVRAAAAEAATSAAERILTQSTRGQIAEDLIRRGIEDVKKKLN